MQHVDKHVEESLHNVPFNMHAFVRAEWVTFNEATVRRCVASGCAASKQHVFGILRVLSLINRGSKPLGLPFGVLLLLFAIPLFFIACNFDYCLIFSNGSTVFSSLDSGLTRPIASACQREGMLLPLVQLVRTKKAVGQERWMVLPCLLSRNLPTPSSLSRSNSTQGSAFLFLTPQTVLPFYQNPPTFIYPKAVRVLMGCNILDMLLHLDLSLLEVLFVYIIKMSGKGIFSLFS
ncbi:hypothetical protein CK203_062543 [Vitis vinifera]|uniref:Uncharacterized protein n=1 Tax=Vitis vinifera TaxID=29760 RepID=A0A438FWT2_VITVI|nr:hypothetical protein CK203_062543 [Vitis vinifera]